MAKDLFEPQYLFDKSYDSMSKLLVDIMAAHADIKSFSLSIETLEKNVIDTLTTTSSLASLRRKSLTRSLHESVRQNKPSSHRDNLIRESEIYIDLITRDVNSGLKTLRTNISNITSLLEKRQREYDDAVEKFNREVDNVNLKSLLGFTMGYFNIDTPYVEINRYSDYLRMIALHKKLVPHAHDKYSHTLNEFTSFDSKKNTFPSGDSTDPSHEFIDIKQTTSACDESKESCTKGSESTQDNSPSSGFYVSSNGWTIGWHKETYDKDEDCKEPCNKDEDSKEPCNKDDEPQYEDTAYEETQYEDTAYEETQYEDTAYEETQYEDADYEEVQYEDDDYEESPKKRK
jgi:hypothetical protein